MTNNFEDNCTYRSKWVTLYISCSFGHFFSQQSAKNKRILRRDPGESFDFPWRCRFSSKKKKNESILQLFLSGLPIPFVSSMHSFPPLLSSRDEKMQRWYPSPSPLDFVLVSFQPWDERKSGRKENITDLSRGCRPSSSYVTVSLSVGHTPVFYLWCLRLIDGILPREPSKLLMDGLYLASPHALHE